jgi:hypothetical protein
MLIVRVVGFVGDGLALLVYIKMLGKLASRGWRRKVAGV